MKEVLERFRHPLWALLASICVSATVFAQTGNGTLSGQVTDPSGAVIPAATVTLTGPNKQTKVAQTDEVGRYAFHNLAPGQYSIQVTTQGFSTFTKAGIEVAAGHPQVVNAQLEVTMQTQQVTVESESQQLSLSPEENVGAMVLKGEALQSLSDDPDDLAEELQQLAGPAAGPNGGEIYIDGFSGGELPPKEAILEVRVNQNPFSAQYERLGYGRIDITTKPGFSKYHGSLSSYGNDSSFNSRNPFVATQPGYHSQMYSGSFGGPIGKRASFFVGMYHRSSDSTSIITPVVPTPNFDPEGMQLNQAIPSPASRTNIRPRADFQLSNNNVLSVRYQRWSRSETNDDLSEFSLPSQAYDASGVSQRVQISDTQIISSRTVMQNRFEYRHSTDDEIPLSTDPEIRVLGAFTGGGNSNGRSFETEDRYELQSVTSTNLGKHSLTYGGRARVSNQSANTTAGFNGTYTFPGIKEYSIFQQGVAQGLTPAEIVAAGGGANQFSITTGNPFAEVSRFDYALYTEDTWRTLPNLSLTLGLRFEGQNAIQDNFDFAPRFGLAWGIDGHGKTPKTILRAGAGIFYDRLDTDNLLQAKQLNGLNQQRYVVNSPGFLPPSVPPINSLAGAATYPTIYQVDGRFQSPYVIEGAIGLERQINKNIKTSVTYITTHGIHQLLARNINAPLPGTFDPADPASGVRPFGDVGNIFQYEAAGLYNENQLIANFNVRMGSKVSLFGYYTLSYANANAVGDNSFPMNQYDLSQSYGNAPWVRRNRFFVGGSTGLPWGLAFSPFLVFTSGRPYSITFGEDLNGDSIYNDRPAFAPDACITCSQPQKDYFADPTLGGAVIPVNYYSGPSQFSMNARLSKTFGFGKEVEGGGNGGGGGGGGGGFHHRGHRGLGGRGLSGGGGGERFGGSSDRRFTLELGVMAHNVFNKVNLGTPVGNLTSPDYLFGHSNSLAGGFFSSQSANRSINLFARFNF